MSFFHKIRKYVTIEVVVLIAIFALCIYVYVKYDVSRSQPPGQSIDSTNAEITFDDMLVAAVRNAKQYAAYSPLKALHPQRPQSSGRPQSSQDHPRGKPQWKMEELCRDIFEKLFDRKFPSARPLFLRNPTTGQNLELDGYCPELNLAFEYDGGQHAKYIPHFHKHGPTEFMYQVTKDDYKTKKCAAEGIDLIRIPHYIHKEKLHEYITRQLKKIGRMP